LMMKRKLQIKFFELLATSSFVVLHKSVYLLSSLQAFVYIL
jgi:hypothetical protein